MTVEHRGFDCLPLDHSARHGFGVTEAFTRMMSETWTGLLAGFGEHVTREREGTAA